MNIGYLGLGERFNAKHAGFVHTYSIVESLNSIEDNDVTLYIRPPEEKIEIEEEFEVKTYSLKFSDFLNPGRTLRHFQNVRKGLDEYDVIQERFRFNPINNFLTSGFNDKLVLEVNGPAHEVLDFPKNLLIPSIERKFDSAARIIVQSQKLKEIISKHTETPVRVVPNGVDTEKFRPDHEREDEVKESYNVDWSKPVVVFVGSFGDWHGVHRIPELARKVPEAEFLLVGDGDMFDRVKEDSRELENITLTGKVPHEDVAPVLAASDIGIAPFDLEKRKDMDKHGFWFCPVKIFEYMAAGLPTISFDLDEIENITGDSGNLAENKNWDDLKSKIEELLEDTELRKEKSEAARKRAEENYTWNEIARQTQEVYEEIV